MQQLGKSDVERAFAEMGEILYRAKKVVEIAVFGGTAILLQFEAKFCTGDVNAKVQAGDGSAVHDAARVVAERHGWLRSWFSEAVTTYLSAGQPDEADAVLLARASGIVTVDAMVGRLHRYFRGSRRTTPPGHQHMFAETLHNAPPATLADAVSACRDQPGDFAVLSWNS